MSKVSKFSEELTARESSLKKTLRIRTASDARAVFQNKGRNYDSTENVDGDFLTVEKGTFLVTIVEGGTLEAVNEISVRNEGLRKSSERTRPCRARGSGSRSSLRASESNELISSVEKSEMSVKSFM